MMTKPYPTGEFAVGTKTFTIYNTRKEVLDTKGESMRHVCARIYYPTLKESTNGLKKAISMSRNKAKGIAKAFKSRLITTRWRRTARISRKLTWMRLLSRA